MIRTTQKGSKKHITSSYFDDLRLLKKSRYETDYRDLKRNSNFDTHRLQLAYVVQEMLLWRRGCIELSDYVHKLSNDQLKDLITDYVGKDYEEWIEPIDIKEEKEIADPDN